MVNLNITPWSVAQKKPSMVRFLCSFPIHVSSKGPVVASLCSLFPLRSSAEGSPTQHLAYSVFEPFRKKHPFLTLLLLPSGRKSLSCTDVSKTFRIDTQIHSISAINNRHPYRTSLWVAQPPLPRPCRPGLFSLYITCVFSQHCFHY